MIEITDTVVFGFDAAIRGMRNPMDSWALSDSFLCNGEQTPDCDGCSACTIMMCSGEISCTQTDSIGWHKYEEWHFALGETDMQLCKKLIKAGTDHRKFLRMIHVQMDVKAPLYYWKEADVYKVGTVSNSCSTMHRIHAKEFTIEDFSVEHLTEGNRQGFEEQVVKALNTARKNYLETKDKNWWWNMIQMLPSSYNQLRTLDLNYEVLMNMYHARKNHKLDEWRDFCKWIEKLPYMKDFLEANDGRKDA